MHISLRLGQLGADLSSETRPTLRRGFLFPGRSLPQHLIVTLPNLRLCGVGWISLRPEVRRVHVDYCDSPRLIEANRAGCW